MGRGSESHRRAIKVLARVPMGRVGKPSELKTAARPASGPSSYVTGQVFVQDGAYLA
jgi:NAD(P)-dependent dehydrogenase (short-subunit alcohol dehydrogenase family)